jgi:hypothetical protein
MSKTAEVKGWMLDSSTFINSVLSEKAWIVPALRAPLFLPEYVFRVELGAGARATTRREAQALVARGKASIEQLTLSDLEKIARLCAPKRIGTGEMCCAIIAAREQRGVLCDDHKAHRWLGERVSVAIWESIEDVLVAAGVANHLSEYEVEECQKALASNRYRCRFDLRFEVLRRRGLDLLGA